MEQEAEELDLPRSSNCEQRRIVLVDVLPYLLVHLVYLLKTLLWFIYWNFVAQNALQKASLMPQGILYQATLGEFAV